MKFQPLPSKALRAGSLLLGIAIGLTLFIIRLVNCRFSNTINGSSEASEIIRISEFWKCVEGPFMTGTAANWPYR